MGIQQRLAVVLPSLTIVAVAPGCVLLGGAPPRPPPPEGPSLERAPRAPPSSGDILLEAEDEASAEDSMKRRCGGGYVVSFVGASSGERCRPTKLYPTRLFGRNRSAAATPRCVAHQRVVVHYRCEATANEESVTGAG